MREIVIYIDGKDAVNIANKFQGNYCYRGIYSHGKRVAALEVVETFDGEELVTVTVLNERKFWDVLTQLAKLGFSGLSANVETFKGTYCYRGEDPRYDSVYIII